MTPDHCPVHDPSNAFCPSCIVAKRDAGKESPEPIKEDIKPEPKQESKPSEDEHHED